MTVAAALALVLATASPEALDEARRAFAVADYAAAERLALVAAAGDEPAPALYLAGLARFRTGRPAEALEALDQAEAGADSAAAWRFNRGACLYELGRFAEAEAAFLEAAVDPILAPLALVNAGFAALDGGAPERARALAARARAAADDPSRPLVDELEQALAPAPTAPLPPPPAPPTSPSSAFSVTARAEVGQDTDASRAGTGAVERPGNVTHIASDLSAAWVAAEGRATAAGLTFAAGYGFSQVAYLAKAAEDYGVQQHDLLLALRARPASHLQLELALTGQYALAGLPDLRGLQAAGGARVAAALEVGEGQTTRAELSLTAKDGRGQEFAALDGSRLEAAASHERRWARFTLRGGYRFQLERIGVVTSTAPLGPAGEAVDVERLSYAGHTGWLGLRLEPWSWLRLDLLGGAEGRRALEDLRTVVRTPEGALLTGLRRRSDLRGFGGEAVALRLAPWISLTLRHDWLANRTQLDPVATGGMGPGSRGTMVTTWEKHVFGAGAALEW
jgi:tetratricopeptide (TPR) repeat protein